MIILGLDPGTEHSAIVIYDTCASTVNLCADLPNRQVRQWLRSRGGWPTPFPLLAIEKLVLYSKVGNSCRDTLIWTGRFAETWESRGGKVALITRAKVAGVLGAKGDKAIRAMLIARFGLKDAQGQRIATHEWSALAVALTAANGIQIDRKEKDNG